MLHYIDINECATNQHNCSDRMNCTNMNGSYKCTNDTDINECNVSNLCHPNAKCINENGNISCECDTAAGYQGNGSFYFPEGVMCI